MKYNQIAYLIAATLSAILWWGCTDEVYDDVRSYTPYTIDNYLKVDPTELKYSEYSDYDYIHIYTASYWTLKNVPEWLEPAQTSGNNGDSFKICASSNTSSNSRVGVFYVTLENSTSSPQVQVTATQSGRSPYVNFSGTSSYPSDEYSKDEIVGAGSETLTYGIDTNLGDEYIYVDINEQYKSWLSASYSNKVLTVTIAENLSNYKRTGTVYLRGNKDGRSDVLWIDITQSSPSMSINDGESISIDADGGTINAKVKSDVTWQAWTDDSWIEPSPTSGSAGESNIKITVLPSYNSSSRTGYIYLNYTGAESWSKRISITQSGRSLSVSPTSVTLDADGNGASKQLTVSGNTDWRVNFCSDWITVTPNSGTSGNSHITVSASKNNSINSRSGSFRIESTNNSAIYETVNVTQKGLDFGDNVTLNFGWNASSQSFAIPVPGAWNASVSAGWISLSQYMGQGQETINVNVTRNDNDSERVGTVTFTIDNKAYTLNVVQSGQYLTISNTAGEFSAMGGAVELTVASSVGATYAIEYDKTASDWIHIEESSNDNTATYQLNVDFNPAATQRQATFVVTPTAEGVSDEIAQGVKFVVTQFGRTLSADVSEIHIKAAGGTTEQYHINAEGSYTISKDEADTWYTLVHNPANDMFYLVVSENTGESRVGTITIALTKVTDGPVTHTITVVQYKEGITVEIGDYEDEIIL